MLKHRLFPVLLLGLFYPNVVTAQLDQVRESAAYALRVNELNASFLLLMNRTVEYDDLAEGIVVGDVSASYARRQARNLSVELWSTYKRLTDKLQVVPAPPASIQNRSMRGRLSNLRSMANTSKEMARSFISSGEGLVEAAISGDPGVLDELQIRGIKVMTAQLEQQIAHFDVQLAYENEKSFAYPLTAAMKFGVEAVVVMLHATLEAYNKDTIEALSDAKAVAARLVETGFEFVDNGRTVTRKLRRKLMANTPENSDGKYNNQLIMDMLEHNISQAFEVEERILREISGLVQDYELLSDEDLDSFMNKTVLLEQERMRLLLERQRRVAEMRQ